MGEIKQRDIVSINFNPTKGREQKGFRPVVVISGDAFHVSQMIVVCPLTSKIKNYVGDVLLYPDIDNKLKDNSEVLVGQLRTVSLSRVSKKLGNIKKEELVKIFEGIDLIFDR